MPQLAEFPQRHTTPSDVPLRLIALDAELIHLAGRDGNSAIFLRQVIHWWQAMQHHPFYKFNAPCGHPYYRAGDSWEEETALPRGPFETARRRIAVKVQGHDPAAIQAALEQGALVVYWSDGDHKTWYHLNEARLQALAPDLYERLLGKGERLDRQEGVDLQEAVQPSGARPSAPNAALSAPQATMTPETEFSPSGLITSASGVKSAGRPRGGSGEPRQARDEAKPAPGNQPPPDSSAAAPSLPMPESRIGQREPRGLVAAVPARWANRPSADAGIAHRRMLDSRIGQREPRALVAAVPARCWNHASADAGITHRRMLESHTGYIPEKTFQKRHPERTTQTTNPNPPPTASATPDQQPNGRQEEESPQRQAEPESYQDGIQRVLEANGIYPEPARRITARALQAQLTPAGMEEILQAQLRQATREGARQPLAVVSWRLQHLPLTLTPLHARSERTQQRLRAFLAEPALAGGAEEGPPAEMEPVEEPAPSEPAATRSHLWQTVLRQVQEQLPRATFDLWIKDTRLEQVANETYTVSTPDARGLDWLEHRLKRLIERTLQTRIKPGIRVEFVLRPPLHAVGGG